MPNASLSDMLGLTFVDVTGQEGAEELVFTAEDGRKFIFYHEQDCCEDVKIEEVWGNLTDLTGRPLTLAEEVTGHTEAGEWESMTWTFYHFGTDRGVVTVRWLGQSNGYYSESVDLRVEKVNG